MRRCTVPSRPPGDRDSGRGRAGAKHVSVGVDGTVWGVNASDAIAVDEGDDLDMDPALRACVQLALAGPHLVPPRRVAR